jgi:hypothetical protein
MGVTLTDIPPHADGGPPDRPPESTKPPPGAPEPRRGLRTGTIVALVIVALILLLFGTCVTLVSQSVPG